MMYSSIQVHIHILVVFPSIMPQDLMGIIISELMKPSVSAAGSGNWPLWSLFDVRVLERTVDHSTARRILLVLPFCETVLLLALSNKSEARCERRERTRKGGRIEMMMEEKRRKEEKEEEVSC